MPTQGLSLHGEHVSVKESVEYLLYHDEESMSQP